MQPRIRLCLAASLLSLRAVTAAAQPGTAPELSAEIVSRDASGAARGQPARLYLAHGVVRIETPEAPQGFFLVDSTARTAVFVQPARRIFTEARQSTLLTQIFVPLDPAEPCRAWQAAAVVAGTADASHDWRCERIDAAAEPAGIVRYRMLPPAAPPGERWIDPQLGFPVLANTADGGTLTVEHLRVGPQPATLFSIPPGCVRLDPQTLIERLRHSDTGVLVPR